jgi:D-sedoheptulose 7-phosphate isomerase
MFSDDYLSEVCWIANSINRDDIENMVNELAKLRKNNGRLFILGVGGSAGNASHAVNDFRKLTGIEAYTPTDNVSELTAITNDQGWEYVFYNWLLESNLVTNDALLILSVGGGNLEKNISVNLIKAIDLAKEYNCRILGIVGKDGYTYKKGDVVIKIPTLSVNRITPHSESFQSVILHLLVSHPNLQLHYAKWESIR